MFTEKLKDLIVAMDRPKGELTKSRLVAQCAELLALVEEAADAPGEAFAVLPPAMRCAGMTLMLALIAQQIGEL